MHMLFALLSMVFVNIAPANTYIKEWRLVKDDEAIQVYVIDVENTDIVKARSVVIVKASLERVKSVLNDISHRHEWVPFLKQSSIIEKYSENSRIEYSLFSAPWPASDRDFVYTLELKTNDAHKHIYEMQSVVTSAMPENSDRIRGEIYESRYILTAIEDELTRVELIYHADPKGWLPDWIINIIQKALPYKILKNLRHRLNEQAQDV